MDQIGPGTSFFAYGSTPPLRAETMRDAVRALNARGQKATTWESLRTEGTLLVDTICKQINSSGTLVAEVSTMNPNVLFELGYAIARYKPVWLAFDETDIEAERNWNDVGLLSTIGRTDYGGDYERLVNTYFASPPFSQQPILDTLIAGALPRENNAVFAPSLPTKFGAAVGLERMLERQTHLKILGSSEDLIIAPLSFYLRETYRASAAILHLLGEHRTRSFEHNARASFLAGFAHGLDLPILMVVESGYRIPLDYRDLMYQYETSAQLQEHVRNWLASIPKPQGSNKRLGRLSLDIELPIRSFGQYVAEYEVDELDKYFVQTSEFASIIAGDARIFTGRKGTGKTATMSQASRELALDRRNLVVAIKPSSYELTTLIELMNSITSSSHSEYLLMTLWTYIIYTEVAVRAVKQAESHPFMVTDRTDTIALGQLLTSMGIDLDESLAVRLERVVQETAQKLALAGVSDHDQIAHALRVNYLNKLRILTVRSLIGFDRVAILIDNLDKNWEKGSDYEALSKFILSLLTTVGTIEKDFARSVAKGEVLNVTLTVFLRTDIFDVVSRFAREPDKIGVRTVQWTDEQLLVRVLEERFAANRTSKSGTPDMWADLFCTEVRGLPARDYFLWRALPRPRDFVYFANAALTTAINRKHQLVEQSDVIVAEKEYSRFAIEALLVESEAQGFDLEELLYEFAGLGAIISRRQLDETLAQSTRGDQIRSWLIAASFLGLEMTDGAFVYVEGETDARRKTKVAERHAKRADRAMRFCVHPAFRAFLEISDDDLHESVREGTA